MDASDPWQFGGLTMQMFSKALVCVVLACLLLSGENGSRRPLHRARGDNHFGRECHRVSARLRRCRPHNPSHHPVRPCKNALLPADEDDDDGDRDRINGNNDGQGSLPFPVHDQANRALLPTIRSQPLPTNVPRYQTLCLLLI